MRHTGDLAGGRITEDGAYIESCTFLRNFSVVDNTLRSGAADGQIAAEPWGSAFLFIGNVRGLTVARNTLTRAARRAVSALPDVVTYSDSQATFADNVCRTEGATGPVPCVRSNSTE